MTYADEAYDEAVTASFRRVYRELIESGLHEADAECEAKERAEAEVAKRVRDGRERDAEDRYHVRKLFAAA
ncbi:hypothetical protein IP92_05778 [Pseudoduganella flava]|uniref:Uncharacterized protein n=1 Tax=Pseudoduganella flava TaxID=871742 RepID=A0A562P9C3_9BURK|nr:hypothetical protein [Pseudoduganella flava]QGZ42692.1 hypothetical protein GO485_29105 [Pseudoduganella flava]TWI41057.1 hypothetical protein IP92_05778 [Pseudoduganella flava]